MISEGTFRPPGNLFLTLLWRSFRPSGPCCLGVAEAPVLSLESSKTAAFLLGSESNVKQ